MVETVQTREAIKRLIENIRSIIFIDEKKLEYLIASKIAGGHVILADFHGVGKTSLARALAGSIVWDTREENVQGVRIEPFNRIQCTVDLLPQDILGYSRFASASDDMIFMEGPIFAHFILCDEINLLTPKTQGSFFQASSNQSFFADMESIGVDGLELFINGGITNAKNVKYWANVEFSQMTSDSDDLSLGNRLNKLLVDYAEGVCLRDSRIPAYVAVAEGLFVSCNNLAKLYNSWRN